ncbi:MAG: LCP family protein [Eubacteriales bacterium]|nr:LCP family protein [Eubacteriales bacterium]
MEQKKKSGTNKKTASRSHNKTTKKAKRWLKWTLIVLGALLVLGIVLALVLGGTLFSRMLKPGTMFGTGTETPLPTIEATPEPTSTPTPQTAIGEQTPEPTPTPVPTPAPTPVFDELYPQTRLTNIQKQTMETLNNMTDRVVNVLLVGVDRRGNAGNSSADTIMIATMDKFNNRLKLTSLLRDMYVEIPGYEPDKLNSSASKGGMDLLFSTIDQNFHVKMDKYVLVDFNMFEKAVDAMGGITLRMTAEEISAANDCIAGLNKQRGVEYLWDGFIFAAAGNVKCTGKQALGYARIRKIDSDFQRTNRQFKVLTAIFAKFKRMDAAKQYSVMYKLMPLVETNLDAAQAIDLGLAVLGMNSDGLLHYSVPEVERYSAERVIKKQVLLTDLPYHAYRIHEFIYFEDKEPEEAKVLSPGESLPPRTPSPTLDPSQYILLPDGSYQLPDGTVITPVPAEIPEIPVV